MEEIIPFREPEKKGGGGNIEQGLRQYIQLAKRQRGGPIPVGQVILINPRLQIGVTI
jgi:hypothetical protein